MTKFYKRYCELCVKSGVSVSRAAAAIGLSNAAANGWKKGKVPQDTTLVKLADYFGVSVQYLMGEEQKENPTASGEVDFTDMELLSAFNSADESTKQAIRLILGLK